MAHSLQYSIVVMGFQYGEMILAISKANPKKSIKFRSGMLFNLKEGATCKGGVTHDDLVARGSDYIDNGGNIFRRPTLDEYVVLMRRVPAPTYPQHARAMVAMMDVSEGDKVLEAGSGSGGLTLYLSKDGKEKNRGVGCG